jgi:hypothetical protein
MSGKHVHRSRRARRAGCAHAISRRHVGRARRLPVHALSGADLVVAGAARKAAPPFGRAMRSTHWATPWPWWSTCRT